MDYDVLILGGGIVGCSIAYELSKYNLNIAVIERDSDVIDDISYINASIIYDGSEAKDDKTALLEKEGRQLINEACKKFKVDINNVSAIRIANNKYELDKITNMYDVAQKRGMGEVELFDAKQIGIEINNIDVLKGLYSKNICVVNPYELAVAYGEVAFDNGVSFKFHEEVVKLEQLTKSFKVTTNKGKYSSKVVINTISKKEYSTEIKEESNEQFITYLIVENRSGKCINNIILSKLEENVLFFNIPSRDDQLILCIKNNKILTIEEAFNYCSRVIPNLKVKDVINMYTEKYENSMVIDFKEIDKGYINFTGSNYSKMTTTPAISKKISEIISVNLNVKMKKDFIDKRREVYRFSKMSDKERNEIIKIDKRYGKIICLCNYVTEGEIVDCIRRPLGARTVEGVRKRTGAGLGCCYSSFCSTKIIKILAKEMDIKLTDVLQDEKNSKIWVSRIKEFDEV